LPNRHLIDVNPEQKRDNCIKEWTYWVEEHRSSAVWTANFVVGKVRKEYVVNFIIKITWRYRISHDVGLFLSGKFLFVKIINSLADIQIKFTHVYLSV
jgi:hypothetical protein